VYQGYHAKCYNFGNCIRVCKRRYILETIYEKQSKNCRRQSFAEILNYTRRIFLSGKDEKRQ
jgi:hypothetical protein